MSSEDPIKNNEILATERIKQIYKDFDWNLYHELVDELRAKFKSPLNEKNMEDWETQLAQMIEFSSVIMGDTLRKDARKSNLMINRNIDALAMMDRRFNLLGNMVFNPKELARAIPRLSLEFRKVNLPVDFDLIYFFVVKVILHELLHKEGNVGEGIGTEVVLECISYVIMREYVQKTGVESPKHINKILELETRFMAYGDEVEIFLRFVSLASHVNGTSQENILVAFFQSFLRRSSPVRTKQISTLPNNIKEIWTELSKLKRLASEKDKQGFLDYSKILSDIREKIIALEMKKGVD